MTIRRRKAEIEATLVFVDEPLVLTLVAGNSRLIAVAVPSEDDAESLFFAVTVHKKDWEKYLSGIVDLRYLYVYPMAINAYTFDLRDAKDNMIWMSPYEGDIPEDYIPSAKFFSRNHTEYYSTPAKAEGRETLLIDGEWELPDFGHFQQKFSDIYAFLKSEDMLQDSNAPADVVRRVVSAFTGRPFQGGFSYVHFFRDLNDNVPAREQINLKGVSYNSPGTVRMSGNSGIFADVKYVIENFLENRIEIRKIYNEQYNYLSEYKYLAMGGDQYGKNNPSDDYINGMSRKLAEALTAPNFELVSKLTGGNALVSAKIVMSFYRRVNDASLYFSQGRIDYSK